MKRSAATHIALWIMVTACGSAARLPVTAGIGVAPVLPPPETSFIPLVNVVDAKGWRSGKEPRVADGLEVNKFASGLSHPRWLYVLPNGDVLVAETNAPERPEMRTGVRNWFLRLRQMKRSQSIDVLRAIAVLLVLGRHMIPMPAKTGFRSMH